MNINHKQQQQEKRKKEMGNQFCKRRNTIEERFTRPQRLIRQPTNVDYKKLKKLILSHKLAPCYDALEESIINSDLEECPICFFFYPSLNRSRCCSKGICTECFLQMNPSNAIRPAQCPFCKSSGYAVEYRGAKTQEEKGVEQAEEQKFIEAKIRMQFQESQTTDQITSVSQHLSPVEVQCPTDDSAQQINGWVQDVGHLNMSLQGRGMEVSESPFPSSLNERHAEFGLNFDEVMLMEAIWQSIQGSSPQQSSESYAMGVSQQTYGLNQRVPYLVMTGDDEVPSSNSLTGGVAAAIATLAERNILQSETFNSACERVQTSHIQDENYNEHQSRLLSTLSHGASMLPMGLATALDSELNDTMSENDCLTSCSTTEDNSWDSLSAHIPDGSEVSEDELLSDEDLMKDENDNTSSCSSVHTISDLSCGSPNCSDMYGSQNLSLLSDCIATGRHQRALAEFHL